MPAAKRQAATTVAAHAGINAAMFAVQQQMPEFQKTEVNPHFGSQYASLETILPKVLEILGANGVIVMQFPTTIDGRPGLRTCFTHVASGEQLEDVTTLELGGKPSAQAHAASITYMRRYALVSAIGIVLEKDDDGNAASRTATVIPAPEPVDVTGATTPPLAMPGGLVL